MRLSRMIPAGLATVLSLTAVRSGATQSFEGVIGLRTPNGPLEASIKGSKARFTAQGPMGPATIIIDPEKAELNIVVDASKMVMVMKLERTDSTAPDTTTVVTPLGKKETIAGHQCDVFRIAARTGVNDVCIASGLNVGGASGLFGGGAGMGGGRNRAGLPGWAREVARRGGFPLRVADTTGAVSYEVTRIEAKSLADSLFVPPAGYQRMEMPSFGRPPGDR